MGGAISYPMLGLWVALGLSAMSYAWLMYRLHAATRHLIAQPPLPPRKMARHQHAHLRVIRPSDAPGSGDPAKNSNLGTHP